MDWYGGYMSMYGSNIKNHFGTGSDFLECQVEYEKICQKYVR